MFSQYVVFESNQRKFEDDASNASLGRLRNYQTYVALYQELQKALAKELHKPIDHKKIQPISQDSFNASNGITFNLLVGKQTKNEIGSYGLKHIEHRHLIGINEFYGDVEKGKPIDSIKMCLDDLLSRMDDENELSFAFDKKTQNFVIAGLSKKDNKTPIVLAFFPETDTCFTIITIYPVNVEKSPHLYNEIATGKTETGKESPRFVPVRRKMWRVKPKPEVAKVDTSTKTNPLPTDFIYSLDDFYKKFGELKSISRPEPTTKSEENVLSTLKFPSVLLPKSQEKEEIPEDYLVTSAEDLINDNVIKEGAYLIFCEEFTKHIDELKIILNKVEKIKFKEVEDFEEILNKNKKYFQDIRPFMEKKLKEVCKTENQTLTNHANFIEFLKVFYEGMLAKYNEASAAITSLNDFVGICKPVSSKEVPFMTYLYFSDPEKVTYTVKLNQKLSDISDSSKTIVPAINESMLAAKVVVGQYINFLNDKIQSKSFKKMDINQQIDWYHHVVKTLRTFSSVYEEYLKNQPSNQRDAVQSLVTWCNEFQKQYEKLSTSGNNLQTNKSSKK